MPTMINKRATLAAGDQPKAAKQGADHLMYQPSVLALTFFQIRAIKKRSAVLRGGAPFVGEVTFLGRRDCKRRQRASRPPHRQA